MQTYIKTEDVEKFAYSLIMDSRHLKSAIKQMNRNMDEEDDFIRNLIKGNLKTFTPFQIAQDAMK